MLCRFRMVLAFPLAAFLSAAASADEDRRLFIAAPPELVESGFLKHLLPRFSLKHAIPITLVAPTDPADARLTADAGTPVFSGAGATWHVDVSPEAVANPNLKSLLDWLASDTGAQAIEGFAGPPVFALVAIEPETETTEALPGDVARGAELSLTHCGRCHVIGPQNRMKGLGSTPSFAALRTFTDWESRFSAFFALKPHPAFTQVEGVTPPFAPGTTPTTSPLLLTPQELEDITAYAASLAPADLGAPIRHQ